MIRSETVPGPTIGSRAGASSSTPPASGGSSGSARRRRRSLWGHIGSYELQEEVERGGQGIVFRAREVGTDRVIALKRLHGGSFAAAGSRLRFLREVETAASLDHPGIVTVYGMDVVDGAPLLSMEWIDGVPATDWARGRDPQAILELFARVCDAVQHAHARGVLHRDLKPSNILVDANDQPHVLDFGLAKSFAPEDVADGRGLTRSGELFGTPAYASPEQLSADDARLDERTDVYSLGVLLYEMLAGRSPYGEWSNLPELLRKVDRAAIPAPSSVDPRLDGAVDAILATALARRPAERYRTVSALVEDVRRASCGVPPGVRRPSSWDAAPAARGPPPPRVGLRGDGPGVPGGLRLAVAVAGAEARRREGACPGGLAGGRGALPAAGGVAALRARLRLRRGARLRDARRKAGAPAGSGGRLLVAEPGAHADPRGRRGLRHRRRMRG